MSIPDCRLGASASVYRNLTIGLRAAGIDAVDSPILAKERKMAGRNTP
jgi:hypothetical protein